MNFQSDIKVYLFISITAKLVFTMMAFAPFAFFSIQTIYEESDLVNEGYSAYDIIRISADMNIQLSIRGTLILLFTYIFLFAHNIIIVPVEIGLLAIFVYSKVKTLRANQCISLYDRREIIETIRLIGYYIPSCILSISGYLFIVRFGIHYT